MSLYTNLLVSAFVFLLYGTDPAVVCFLLLGVIGMVSDALNQRWLKQSRKEDVGNAGSS